MKLRDLNRFLICFQMAKDAIMRDDADHARDSAIADLRAALEKVEGADAMPFGSPVRLDFFKACCAQVRAWFGVRDDMQVELLDSVTPCVETLARWQDGRLQDQLDRRLQAARMAGR